MNKSLKISLSTLYEYLRRDYKSMISSIRITPQECLLHKSE
ncbi:MAG: hypothetical protein RIC35_25130 [Marinoscillum sp.]